MRRELAEQVCRARRIDRPCPRCGGLGWSWYGSTSVWRGGAGGSAITQGICSKCWGSGDADCPWADQRKLEAAVESAHRESGAKWLVGQLGVNLGTTGRTISRLAALAEKESRRRKLPEGEDEYWWRESWLAVAAQLRKLLGP